MSPCTPSVAGQGAGEDAGVQPPTQAAAKPGPGCSGRSIACAAEVSREDAEAEPMNTPREEGEEMDSHLFEGGLDARYWRRAIFGLFLVGRPSKWGQEE